MRWTRDPRRSERLGCRPGLEPLEVRTVLSTVGHAALPLSLAPQPAPTQSPAPPIESSQSYEDLIGAAAVRRAYGVDGRGLTAAVIDTGVGYRHDALGDGLGAGRKVVAGYDFGDGDGDPDATTWNHGTAVAGLIASADPRYPGVAPGADIVALRVFDSENRGSYEKIADALRWVIDNHQRYDISVVNLSIADGGNYTYDFFGRDGAIGQEIAGLIDELKALRIPVVSAAGNSFKGEEGMGFTAILAETISVTATDGNDALLSNAQRLGASKGKERATDLAAPGSGLMAPSDGEGFSSVRGTSFSTPLVSGSILILQSLYQERFGELPTVDQVESWLEKGSVPIVDTATGITLARLDLQRAAALVPGAPAATPDPSPPASGPAANPTQPPAGSDSPAEDGDPSKPSPPPPPEAPDTPGEDSDPSASDDSESTPPTTDKPSTPPSTDKPSTPPSRPPADPPSPPVDSLSSPPSVPDAEPVAPEPRPPAPPTKPSAPPIESPAPPVESPAPPADPPSEGEATDAAVAELYRNGRFLGEVELGSDEDPSRGALDAFGIRGTVRTIHLWSPIQQGADAEPGPAQAAGETAPQVRERRAARRAAAIQQRAEAADALRTTTGRRFDAFVRRVRGW